MPLTRSPRRWALAIFLAAAVPAAAQDRPAHPDRTGARPASPSTATAVPAATGAWSNYRPGTAWGPAHPGRATSPAGTPAPAYIVTQSGWKSYAPSSAWTTYRGKATPTAAAPAPTHVPVYVSQPGWAGYAPSSSWATYRAAAGWQSYEPSAARPLNMRQAHVPGPSPYADGLARNYYEYGTGRPVPLAKPWLPGAP